MSVAGDGGNLIRQGGKDLVGGGEKLSEEGVDREDYVFNHLDELVPDHGGNIIRDGDQMPSFNGSHPDILSDNKIIEVTGENPDGTPPKKLEANQRGTSQLVNFAKGKGNREVILLYEGDTDKIPIQNVLRKWGIKVQSF